MAAIRIWVRGEWRRGWRELIVVGLIMALGGGVTMAAAAGARRADSAIERFQRTTNEPQVELELVTSNLDELQELVPRLRPAPELADRIAAVEGVDGVTVWNFLAVSPEPEGPYFNAGLGAQRGRAPSDLLIDGRRFDPGDPYEVMVDESAAREWGGVGSVITVHTLAPSQLPVMAGVDSGDPAGPTIDLRVVGVLRDIEAITDVPEPILAMTPAFVEQFGDQVAMIPGVVQVATRIDPIDALLADIGAAAGEHFEAHVQDEDYAGRVDEAVSIEVAAMWAFALAAAVAGLLIVYLAISRRNAHLAAERSTRRALGFTRRLDLAASVAWAAPAIAVGALGSLTLAVSVSGLFPRGIARRAEPSPGLLVDRPVLLAGAAALLVGGVALAGLAGWTGQRQSTARPTRAGVAGRLRGALWPAPQFGLRLAFSGDRRAQASRAGVIGAAIAVGGVLAVIAVTWSADHVRSTPRLFGAGWDAVVPVDPEARPDGVLERLAAEPDVVGVGTLDMIAEEQAFAVGPGGRTFVEPEALVARAGSIAPTLIAGRLPAGPGEVAIGDTVSEELGADIGDTVVVTGYQRKIPVVVVGRVLNAGTDELGNGFNLTRDGLEAITLDCPDDTEELKCLIRTQGIGVALRDGVDVDIALDHLRRIDEDFVATPVPSVINNLRQIGAAPWYLAAFLTVLGVSALGHSLATGRRLGRHDVAVTRALGLSPGQTAAALCWQAFALAVSGALAGVALGLLAGRFVWRRVSEGTGALVETVVPTWAWVAVPAAAVLTALALAVWPAVRVAGERPAEILRTE
jgi:hypothetical protein